MTSQRPSKRTRYTGGDNGTAVEHYRWTAGPTFGMRMILMGPILIRLCGHLCLLTDWLIQQSRCLPLGRSKHCLY